MTYSPRRATFEQFADSALTVAGVETRGFARTKEQSPSGQEFHWNRNWESYYLIGDAMGRAMVGLVDK